MALAQPTGRSRYRLALLVLTAVTLLTLDFRGFGPLETAQRTLRDLIEPIASGAEAVVSPVGRLWNGAFNYDELQAENERLRAELDSLRGSAIQNEADLEAYRRLLDATAIDYIGDVERVAASVIRGSVTNFDFHVLTIDKGSAHGLEPGMAVVTGAGFVGRLDRVDTSTSTVELVSSEDVTIGVRFTSIDDVGLGHGSNDSDGPFIVDRGLSWPDDADEAGALPEIGSAVVTSAESRYPADIPIGVVSAVTRAGDDLTMVVEVQLAVDVAELGFVTVLLVDPDDTGPVPVADPTVLDPLPGVVPEAPTEDDEG